MRFNGSILSVTGSQEIYKSGSLVFDVQGSVGQLFSITDSLVGDIFSVADISGIPILNVNASGSVTIDGQLTVSGTTTYLTGALGVGTSTPTTVGLIRATNDVIAYYSSDINLKTNLLKISGSLDILKQINGYSFDWIPMEGIHENEGRDIGVIAQEIEKVLPELVTTRDNGYKAVKYEKIVALLIESNKELLKRIEVLESKIL
jgi:hypothetical protein